MAEAQVLDATTRTESGRSVARQLRREGSIPAVIYGAGRDPEPLVIKQIDFEKALAAVTGTTLIKIKVGSKTSRALIQEIQRHPTRSQILHVDFLEVKKGEKLTVRTPIRLIGIPDGVRNQGGVLDQILRELEIRVLPKDLPDHINIDVTKLTVGQSIHVRDIEIVADAEILVDLNMTVCSVIAARVEEVTATTVDEEEDATGEPELIRKEKEEEDGEADSTGSKSEG
jgi:large subunit ribosomal protein L25